MIKNKVPERLWEYRLVWISETGNLSVSSSRYASGRTPLAVSIWNLHFMIGSLTTQIQV